jgi:ankyrin repeat protein
MAVSGQEPGRLPPNIAKGERNMAEAKDIFKAVRRGDVQLAAALLEDYPGLVHAREDDGSTPLHAAAWKGFSEMVQLLIDREADVNAMSVNEHFGGTPLHAAAHGNRKEVAELLIMAGADISVKSANGRNPLEETEVHKATKVAKLLKEHAPR